MKQEAKSINCVVETVWVFNGKDNAGWILLAKVKHESSALITEP